MDDIEELKRKSSLISPEAKEALRKSIEEHNRYILDNINDYDYPPKCKFTDMTGMDINLLHVDYYVGRYNRKDNPDQFYQCTCACGNKPIICRRRLMYGNIKSCGCVGYGSDAVHGLSRNKRTQRLYKIWNKMHDRCYRPNCAAYVDYGGRGITICDEWRIKPKDNPNRYQGLQNFIEWSINNGYDKSLSIDRIDNDCGYSPDNCRWVNKKIQGNNNRVNHYVQLDRYVFPITIWSEITGVPMKMISSRILNSNWDPIDAILIPPKETRRLLTIEIPSEYEIYNKYDEWVKKGKIKPVEETIYKDCPYIEHK